MPSKRQTLGLVLVVACFSFILNGGQSGKKPTHPWLRVSLEPATSQSSAKAENLAQPLFDARIRAIAERRKREHPSAGGDSFGEYGSHGPDILQSEFFSQPVVDDPDSPDICMTLAVCLYHEATCHAAEDPVIMIALFRNEELLLFEAMEGQTGVAGAPELWISDDGKTCRLFFGSFGYSGQGYPSFTLDVWEGSSTTKPAKLFSARGPETGASLGYSLSTAPTDDGIAAIFRLTSPPRAGYLDPCDKNPRVLFCSPKVRLTNVDDYHMKIVAP